ncbi:MAG: tRNA (guanosine(46)-N7)-methyltransferase TrmB [Gammaproteobacteria bacterium]
MSQQETENPRRIRSFIRRQGRLTAAQQNALAELGERYCLRPETRADFSGIFGRCAPRVLEIGFGNGESLAEMAKANPDIDYIGIEVHRPGVGHLLLKLEQEKIDNVRIYCHDAVEILENVIADGSLSAVHLFFPDPWPKKRHHKRRIVRPEFVGLIAEKLEPGGYFHAATDWENYAESMLEILGACNRLVNASPSKDYCERPQYRPVTKFENRGIRLGHGVRDLLFFKPKH